MDDYIEREAFKSKYLCCGYLPEMSEEEFNNFPAADVAPVVHGRWLKPHWALSRQRVCSVCHNTVRMPSFDSGEYTEYPGCPWCLAKMDGGDEGCLN